MLGADPCPPGPQSSGLSAALRAASALVDAEDDALPPDWLALAAVEPVARIQRLAAAEPAATLVQRIREALRSSLSKASPPVAAVSELAADLLPCVKASLSAGDVLEAAQLLPPWVSLAARCWPLQHVDSRTRIATPPPAADVQACMAITMQLRCLGVPATHLTPDSQATLRLCAWRGCNKAGGGVQPTVPRWRDALRGEGAASSCPAVVCWDVDAADDAGRVPPGFWEAGQLWDEGAALAFLDRFWPIVPLDAAACVACVRGWSQLLRLVMVRIRCPLVLVAAHAEHRTGACPGWR